MKMRQNKLKKGDSHLLHLKSVLIVLCTKLTANKPWKNCLCRVSNQYYLTRATVVKNHCQPRLKSASAFDKVTQPTPLQQKAFELLGVHL